MAITFYYAPGTCALAPHIALEWVGADYEAIRVELGSDDYKKINPSGAVPAMIVDDGPVKTQAGAILQFIADTHPHAKLGADGNAESQFLMNEQLSFFGCDFHPAFWPFFGPQKYTSSSAEDDIQKAKESSHALVDRVMTKLDRQLGKNGGHVVLGRRTIADAYAFAMSRWADYFPRKVRDYPNVQAFNDEMIKDKGVKAALEVHGIKP